MPSGHVKALPINNLYVRIGSSLMSRTINPPIKNATMTATTGEINSRKKFFISFYSKKQSTKGLLPYHLTLLVLLLGISFPFPFTLSPLTVFFLRSAAGHQQSD